MTTFNELLRAISLELHYQAWRRMPRKDAARFGWRHAGYAGRIADRHAYLSRWIRGQAAG